MPDTFNARLHYLYAWIVAAARLASATFAACLLVVPAVCAVHFANQLSAYSEAKLKAAVQPLIDVVSAVLPDASVWQAVATGEYGLLTMLPLMFVWTLPVVLLYAVVTGIYQSSGLLARLADGFEPIARWCGLTGGDVVYVVMGFGCNVPAIIESATGANRVHGNCGSCTTGGNCARIIAYGSICSYQFAATLAVFAAAAKPFLVAPWLLFILITTLIYARVTVRRQAVSPMPRQLPVASNKKPLRVPQAAAIHRETRDTLRAFARQALPVFLLISLIAQVLAWSGLLHAAAAAGEPVMRWFDLPSSTALAMMLASIRKDGLLLLAQPATLAELSSLQLLVAAYLGGVMLPCLVTAWTIRRTFGTSFALGLMLRQATAACLFAWLLTWGGKLLTSANT